MALIKCKECNHDISKSATSCPQCGAKQPKKTSIFTWIVGAFIAATFVAYISNSNSERNAPAKTPEQIAAIAKSEAAFQKTVATAMALKKSLRDPDSMTWESISANDDASVVCFEYRAKNGFGGLNKEFAVFANGKASQSTADWNKHCTKPLINMTHARQAL